MNSRRPGRPIASVAGRDWLDAVHPDDRAHTDAGWSEALRTRTLFQLSTRSPAPGPVLAGLLEVLSFAALIRREYVAQSSEQPRNPAFTAPRLRHASAKS